MTTNDHRFGVFEPCDSPIILCFLLSFATSLRACSIRAVANSLVPHAQSNTHTHSSLPLCTRYRSDRDSYPWLTERAWPYSARNKPSEAYYASVVNNNPRSAPCQTQPPLCMLRMFIVLVQYHRRHRYATTRKPVSRDGETLVRIVARRNEVKIAAPVALFPYDDAVGETISFFFFLSFFFERLQKLTLTKIFEQSSEYISSISTVSRARRLKILFPL